MLYLDTIDVRVIQNFEKLCNECYQKEVQTLIEKYKKISKPITIVTANTIAMDCVTV